MTERHYSDKGGHWKRSLVNKLLKTGVVAHKTEISFCMRRFAKRMPAHGKK